MKLRKLAAFSLICVPLHHVFRLVREERRALELVASPAKGGLQFYPQPPRFLNFILPVKNTARNCYQPPFRKGDRASRLDPRDGPALSDLKAERKQIL